MKCIYGLCGQVLAPTSLAYCDQHLYLYQCQTPYVRDLARRSAQAEDIVRQVSDGTEVPVSVIMGASRMARPSAARKLAMTIIRDELGWTLLEIAEHFHRDKSTVHTAIKSARALLRMDAEAIEVANAVTRGSR